MSFRTLDVDQLADKADNIYETVVLLSKRSRQISARAKAQLDEKLAYYEGFASDMENLRMQLASLLNTRGSPNPPKSRSTSCSTTRSTTVTPTRKAEAGDLLAPD